MAKMMAIWVAVQSPKNQKKNAVYACIYVWGSEILSGQTHVAVKTKRIEKERKSMKKKAAFITGSSRGIGRETALRFAREGYHVIVNGRKEGEALMSLKKEIEDCHVSCLACVGDISKEGTAKEIFGKIKEVFGGLDVLVNNAGVSYVGLLTDMTSEEWEQVLGTNLTSLFQTCRHAVPLMLSQGGGKIINVSSVWGIHGASCEVAYSASKGGVNAFTKALAKELAPSNIQVNAVAFGAVDTQMNEFLSKEEREMLLEEIPVGRMASAAEAAGYIFHLAQAGSYFTGQVAAFDGGWC